MTNSESFIADLAETLFTGPKTLESVGARAREDILAFLPRLADIIPTAASGAY